MKVLVVVSCLLAAASAGLLAPLAYHAPHVPVLDHNGYQIDTADVQLAKAAHFAAHGEALGRLGHVAVAAPIAHAVAAPVLAAPLAYAGPIHIPTIGPNGVPLDTPEVAAGKAANAAAHIEAKARNGDLAVVAPVAHAYAAPLQYAAAAPVVNGVPLDTPEVAHAKAAHFAAHIEAKARNGVIHPLLHYRKRRGILGAYAAPIAAPLAYTTGYYGPQNIPVIGPNGVPLETPEVVAAKIGHAAAHVEAKARNGELAVVAPYAAPLAAGIAAPITTYAAGYAAPLAYAAPQHIPVIGPNGVPLDEPAVAAAKINHAAAHVEAQARNGDYAVVAPVAHAYAAPLAHAVSPLAYTTGYLGPQNIPVIGPNGVPLDTPEVAAGKAANAAAHIEAKVRNGDLALHY